ncbi:MAG: beta-lactamase family protein [Gemmatimonadetes bacterium]|nr:beta-lactamase family protein [Gemmatimonadota bacterium]
MNIQRLTVLTLAAAFTAGACSPTNAQEGLSVAQRRAIDSAAAGNLAAHGGPSVAIAVVREGKIVYQQAYGNRRLTPAMPATTTTRYHIGSISKQFTAAALLLLAEDGKLSLDDKVAKWLPELTRSEDVALHQLLSMTAGYQDFWPQDYVFSDLLTPTPPQKIADRWARIPLDFEPGTKWEYSNTNYTIAGLIVEKASGKGLFEFLQERVFTPLGMRSVVDADIGGPGPADAGGYTRYGLGPWRPAPKEAKGWLFGCGQLAMTAHDLALWDIALINRALLRPASYAFMETEARLVNGLGAGYGLGVNVSAANGRRRISHSGGASGYFTYHEVYPDDRTAIVVLSNDESRATRLIADRIAAILFVVTDTAQATALSQARRIFADLQQGRIDRGLFTPNANAYFSKQAVEDFATSLAPLGGPTEFVPVAYEMRGGMSYRAFRIRAGGRTLLLTTRALPDGSLEQYQVNPDR